MHKHLQSFLLITAGALLGFVLFGRAPDAHAYPEYTDRTGQQCTACHVNPAGGGPRTLRGLLWIAAGRPDEMPPLPGGDQESGAVDGPSIYANQECSRCHGPVGEGGIGGALTGADWGTAELESIIRNGIGAMNGYPASVLSDGDLAVLIPYVQAIGRGEVQPSAVLHQRPLPPLLLGCGAALDADQSLTCNGN